MMNSYRRRAKAETENRPPKTHLNTNTGNCNSGKQPAEYSIPTSKLSPMLRTKTRSPYAKRAAERDSSPLATVSTSNDSVDNEMISPIPYEGRRRIPGLSALPGKKPIKCIGGSKTTSNDKPYAGMSDALDRIRAKQGGSPLVSVEMPGRI